MSVSKHSMSEGMPPQALNTSQSVTPTVAERWNSVAPSCRSDIVLCGDASEREEELRTTLATDPPLRSRHVASRSDLRSFPGVRVVSAEKLLLRASEASEASEGTADEKQNARLILHSGSGACSRANKGDDGRQRPRASALARQHQRRGPVLRKRAVGGRGGLDSAAPADRSAVDYQQRMLPMLAKKR